MRIYSLSKVLAAPFVIALIVLLYLELVAQVDIGWYLIVPIFFIVAIYMAHGEVDYWWLKKHPIPLEKEERAMIEKYSPFYNGLSSADKTKFEKRLSLYQGAREWKNVGQQELVDIPDDVKTLIGSQAIQLTFNDEDYLLGDFDRIYTYKHPFPTPKHQFLHTVETDAEDGVILLAMDHALPGISHSDQYYNIAMHGYADAYIKQYPSKNYPDIWNVTWDHIEQIQGFTKEQILGVLGYKSVDLMPIIISGYHIKPIKTKEVLPEIYAELEKVFGPTSKIYA